MWLKSQIVRRRLAKTILDIQHFSVLYEASPEATLSYSLIAEALSRCVSQYTLSA